MFASALDTKKDTVGQRGPLGILRSTIKACLGKSWFLQERRFSTADCKRNLAELLNKAVCTGTYLVPVKLFQLSE